MDLKQLEAQGLMEKASFNDKQILANLGRARRDLITSKANLSIDEEWAYAIAYHAMLRAGRALMFASGYRPRGKDQHRTVVDFCSSVLGSEFQELVTRFNRMRVKRQKTPRPPRSGNTTTHHTPPPLSSPSRGSSPSVCNPSPVLTAPWDSCLAGNLLP